MKVDPVAPESMGRILDWMWLTNVYEHYFGNYTFTNARFVKTVIYNKICASM